MEQDRKGKGRKGQGRMKMNRTERMGKDRAGQAIRVRRGRMGHDEMR